VNAHRDIAQQVHTEAWAVVELDARRAILTDVGGDDGRVMHEAVPGYDRQVIRSGEVASATFRLGQHIAPGTSIEKRFSLDVKLVGPEDA